MDNEIHKLHKHQLTTPVIHLSSKPIPHYIIVYYPIINPLKMHLMLSFILNLQIIKNKKESQVKSLLRIIIILIYLLNKSVNQNANLKVNSHASLIMLKRLFKPPKKYWKNQNLQDLLTKIQICLILIAGLQVIDIN